MEENFSQSDLIAFRANLLRALEDLKYRREECDDLRKRLEKVLSEKIHAEQNLEELHSKLKTAESKQDYLREELKALSEASNESNQKLESHQLKEAVEAAERTVTSLKKELSLISLAKHSLETKLKQAEERAAARETSSNAVIEKLRSIEAATEKLSKKLREYCEAQCLLERNVEASKFINQELAKVCAHGNCLLKECKKERDKLKEKLLEQECRLRLNERSSSNEQEQILKSEVEALRQKVSHLDRRNGAEMKLVENLRAKLKEAEISASKAHQIAERSTADNRNVIDLEKGLEESEKTRREWEAKFTELSSEHDIKVKEKDRKIAELTSVLADKQSVTSAEIKQLRQQLENAEKERDTLKKEVEAFKEVKLNLHELQMRFDLLVEEKKSLQTELSATGEERKLLESEVGDLNEKLKNVNTAKLPDMADQESQTEIEVLETSVQVDRDNALEPLLCDTNSERETLQICLETPRRRFPLQPENQLVQQNDNLRSDSIEVDGEGVAGVKAVISSTDDGKEENQFLVHTTSQTLLTRNAEGKSYEGREMLGDKLETPNLKSIRSPDEYESLHATPATPSVSANNTDSPHFTVTKSKILHLSDHPRFREIFQPTTLSQKKDVSAEDLSRNRNTFSPSCHTPQNYPETTVQESEEAADDLPKSPMVSWKRSPCVKIAGDRSPVLVKSSAQSVILNPMSRASAEYRKNPTKKRKLSSTPPMLDASQSGVMEVDPTYDPVLKQVPLRVPKNFTKQVLSNKPNPKPEPVRFKPLDVVSGALSTPHSFTPPTLNQPYTNSQFSEKYASLKTSLASKFSGKSFLSTSVENITPSKSASSATSSLGFRVPHRIPQILDEDDVAIEESESDDSM